MRFCEQCGLLLPEGAAFCTVCGTPAPETERSDGRKKRRMLLLVCVLTGALLLSLGWYAGRRYRAASEARTQTEQTAAEETTEATGATEETESTESTEWRNYDVL